jgi:hypothetical protein
VPDNFSEPGLRALADEIAQNRPGPMLLHAIDLDPEFRSLPPAYRFLFSASRPQAPPRSPALFIYCQPYLAPAPAESPAADPGRPLRSSRHLTAKVLMRNSVQEMAISNVDEEGSPLANFFEGTENVAPAAATTERFAEQIELRYQKLARDEVFPEEIGGSQARIVSDVLLKLRNAVANQMSSSNSPKSSQTRSSEASSSAAEGIL